MVVGFRNNILYTHRSLASTRFYIVKIFEQDVVVPFSLLLSSINYDGNISGFLGFDVVKDVTRQKRQVTKIQR